MPFSKSFKSFALALLNMLLAKLEATMKFVPTVFPSLFFFVHATIEIHSAGPNLHEVLDDLDVSFPHSSNIKGMRALVHYHVRGTVTFASLSSFQSGTETIGLVGD
jgi:hypothetical protein